MRKLEFIGTVRSNPGKLTEVIVLAGRDRLFLAPADWPTKLALGTLNIVVNEDGFPEGFAEIGKGNGLQKLDEGRFRPALVIPQRKIAGNTLKPDVDHPTRGFASVWRAELQVIATSQVATCWMLRIIGSDMASQIELVAEEHLRSRLNLADGTEVKVTVFETELKGKLPTPKERITDWCEAARGIEDQFGTDKALSYLIGEKFLDFLGTAERDSEFRAELPLFVSQIRDIFERWQLAEYLEKARQTEPFDPSLYDEDDDPEEIEMERKDDIRRSANDLLLVEWAKELLLNEDGSTG